AKGNKHVKALILVEPSNLLPNQTSISPQLVPFDKPVFIIVKQENMPYILPIIDAMPKNLVMKHILKNTRGTAIETFINQKKDSALWLELMLIL
ncbi:MAG: hypothetical protein HC896_17500, partial [Bacteroidales bacterium]|nr:hypothetical protein [Bacteroidales bacterium]